MPTNTRIQLGEWGEDCACRELRRRGYAILERRYRTRLGEIDIVARDGGVMVFVEVKARRSTTRGTPADALTAQKQRKLLTLAAFYLASKRLADVPCRFDVVTVSASADAAAPKVQVLRDAFDYSSARS